MRAAIVIWSRPEASSARAVNSSPPNRARMSESRKVERRMPVAATRARSPSACPTESLICFRPSTSAKKSRAPQFLLRASFNCCSASNRKPRRLKRPVSSSVSAMLHSSASSFPRFSADLLAARIKDCVSRFAWGVTGARRAPNNSSFMPTCLFFPCIFSSWPLFRLRIRAPVGSRGVLVWGTSSTGWLSISSR